MGRSILSRISSSNKLMWISFMVDFAMWLPWVPLTFLFKNSMEGSAYAPLLSSALFLAPRLFRWLSLSRIGKIVCRYDETMEFIKWGIVALALSLLISSFLRLSILDFILVSLRGVIQAIFDCTRPLLLKFLVAQETSGTGDETFSEDKLKRKSFELSLIPSLAMGLGSLMGGFLSNYITMSQIFIIGFIIAGISIILTLKTGYLRTAQESTINVNDNPNYISPKIESESSFNEMALFRRSFAERFGLATAFGGTPLLMHLKFSEVGGDQKINFSLFMFSISLGVILAMLFSKKMSGFTSEGLKKICFLAAWVFQIFLLLGGKNYFSIICLSIATVYFQFVFLGISTAGLINMARPSKSGATMGLAVKYEIVGAIISHVIYGVGASYLSFIELYVISTLLAIGGAFLFSSEKFEMVLERVLPHNEIL